MFHLSHRCALIFSILCIACLGTNLSASGQDPTVATKPQRLLDVAASGIRNYLAYGGHGLIVFDIDNDHKFVKRIPTGGLGRDGKPINVKGICASSTTARLYLSTIETLQCMDLNTNALLWEIALEGGCDRMSIAPDGRVTHVPFDVIREHAQEHMRSNTIIVPVANRTDVQINRLQTSKRMLDFCKALVRQHDMVRIHSLGRHARAKHVQAIQGCVRRNVVLTTCV